MVVLFTPKQLVLVKIQYYMPDYRLLLNEFSWQVEDEWPKIPRIHQFLLYWKEHIEAPISNVEVCSACNRDWRSVSSLINTQ